MLQRWQRGLVVVSLVSLGIAAHAQLPGLGGGAPRIPGLEDVLGRGPAITTSLPDAKWEDPSRDGFNPEVSDLFTLDRGPNQGFLLKAGAYGGVLQSYCLKAGTHGPGGGEGYLFAPPKGPFDDLVIAIARNAVAKPNIPQREIQLLLWAVIARTKFMDMNSSMKAIATQLLTDRQIVELNGGALGILTDERLGGAIVRQPPIVRQVLEAENKLRGMFTGSMLPFDQFEAVAVLTGEAPWGEGSRRVPANRWSKHPDGYWVRYIPSGYSTTRVEIFVEEGSKAIGKEFDPARHIAVPTNTARQRLLQTARRQTTN